MAAEAGFETMKITAHDAKDQDALFQSIRQTHGTEGSVVYYLNADNKVSLRSSNAAAHAPPHTHIARTHARTTARTRTIVHAAC
jgi:hypothetical protein